MYVSNVMLWYGMVCTVYIYYSNIHYICMDRWNDGRVRIGASQNSLISGFFPWGDVDR